MQQRSKWLNSIRNLSLAMGATIALTAGAQPAPAFLGDNNSSRTLIGSPYGLTSLSDGVYFVGNGYLGTEIYRTDGTPEGTELVVDVRQGPKSSYARNFSEFNGELYFIAFGENHPELWKTNGTDEGTTRVSSPGIYVNDPPDFGFAVADDGLYFTAHPNEGGYFLLYKTNGTPGNEVLVANDVQNDPVASGPYAYYNANDMLYRTDGTPEGTFSLQVSAALLHYAMPLNGRLYVPANLSRAYVTDGTLSGTVRLTPETYSGGLHYAELNGYVYFKNDGPGDGSVYLFRSDGTETGTELLYNVADVGIIYVTGIAAWNNKLAMSTVTSTGHALYISDGTVAGTYKVRNFDEIDEMKVADDKIFVVGRTAEEGEELWISDGSDEGTTVVTPFHPGPASTYVNNVVVTSGSLVFNAGENPESGNIYCYSADTDKLISLELASPAADFRVRYQKQWGDNLLFAGYTGENGWEPWISNGTPEGTNQLLDIREGWKGSNPSGFEVVGNHVFFCVETGAFEDYLRGFQLWKTDGTPAGTIPVHTFMAYNVPLIINVNGMATILVEGNNPGLWRSDGTPAGTYLVAGQIGYGYLMELNGKALYVDHQGENPALSAYDPATSSVIQLVTSSEDWFDVYSASPELNGRRYLVINDTQIWVTDATLAGTSLLTHNENYYEALDHAVNGKPLFLSGSDPVHLYTSNGTSTGTILLAAFQDSNYKMYTLFDQYYSESSFATLGDGRSVFVGVNQESGTELWITDGTASGTQLLKDINPGALSSQPRYLTAAGNIVYFAADDGVHGSELWQTDGTAAGTTLVSDINPGAPGSMPADGWANQDYLDDDQPVSDVSTFLFQGGALIFPADSGSGYEPWLVQSPGMAPVPMTLEPGPDDSFPANFSVVGENIIFTATTQATGADLWSIPVSPAAAVSDWNLYY